MKCTVYISFAGKSFRLYKCEVAFDWEKHIEPQDFQYSFRIDLPDDKGGDSNFGKHIAAQTLPIDCTYTIFWSNRNRKKDQPLTDQKSKIIKYVSEEKTVRPRSYTRVINGQEQTIQPEPWTYVDNVLFLG